MQNSANAKSNTRLPLKIYLRVVIRLNSNEIELELEDHREAPCNFLKTIRYEERLLEIQYTPGNMHTTKAKLIEVMIRAYSRKHDIVKWNELFFDPKVIQPTNENI
jgi:hypothetical protein